MQQIYQLVIGFLLLAFAFPIGNLLARVTKEELKSGKKYFKILIFLSLAGAVTSLIIRNDVLLFSFLFIAIVTSRCIKK